MKIIIMLFVALVLSACSQTESFDYAKSFNDNISYRESEELESDSEELESDLNEAEHLADKEPPPEADTSAEVLEPMPPFDPPRAQISEYGRRVAEEFLMTMTSIFNDVLFTTEHFSVPDGAGRFMIGWDAETGELITTDIPPEIYIGFHESDGQAFFDRHSNRIYDAPWLEIRYGDGWRLYRYANSFRLFDFYNNGIPEIFVHFQQTFDGGYVGAYHIFKYVDGSYRALDMVRTGIGNFSRLFWDSYGRIITFIDSSYHWISEYSHLVLTNDRAESYTIAYMDWDNWENELEAWDAHHWHDWDNPSPDRDSWLHNSPTIFGTNISLTPIEPLIDLENEIMESIMLRRAGR